MISAVDMPAGPHAATPSRRLVPWLALLLSLIAIARIVLTYREFNHTFDEVSHIASAMEWVDKGTYTYEPMHTPMRAVTAIGPYLLGARHAGLPSFWDEGHHILYDYGKYWETLTAARIAILPFFAFTLLIVFLWARRIGGDLAALLALLLYSTLPLALAHAGLATTDALLTATFAAAAYAWAGWLERPGKRASVLFGIAAACALLSKLNALAFLAMIVGGGLLLWFAGRAGGGDGASPMHKRWRSVLQLALLGIPVTILTVWAGYRFSAAPMWTAAGRPHGMVTAIFGTSGTLVDIVNRVVELPIPASQFFVGIRDLMLRNHVTLPSVFMGHLNYGTPAFFPVATLVKSPIPFLLLTFIGFLCVVRAARRYASPFVWVGLLAPLVVFGVGMMMSLNIGLRHVLPAFPFFAIWAGVGAARLWQAEDRRRLVQSGRIVLLLLIGWQAIAGVRAHPYYLAYFNECCDRHPERWLTDSDLDWGQDLQHLDTELRARNIDSLTLAYFGTADPAFHLHAAYSPLEPYQRPTGWLAISESRLPLGTEVPPYDQYRWLYEVEPVARVGKSIRLYKFQ